MLRCVSYENLIGNEIRVVILPAGKDPDDVIRSDKDTWQKLIEQAIPVIDYTFDIITSKLDLNIDSNRILAANKLLEIIGKITDPVRQGLYFHKLSVLTNINENNLLSASKNIKDKYNIRDSKNSEGKVISTCIHPVFSQPLEEYCLALLLQFPKLRSFKNKLEAEYFENSENREIFIALSHNDDLNLIKDSLDYTIWEYLDKLINKEVPSDKLEEKMAVCTLRLHEKCLRSLELKREVIFATEAASKGSIAGLTKLEEQGIEGSAQLREVFSKKSTGGLHGGDSNEGRKYTDKQKNREI
jgi:DNA primase